MKRLLPVFCFLFSALCVVGQQPTNVQKGGAAGVNNITADLNVATGRTLGISSGGTFSYAAGAAFSGSASEFRSDIGLAIGTDVQAFDADLSTWSGITPGTGVGTALGVNIGTAGAFVVNGGALGTPSSGIGSNLTALNATQLTSGTVPVARLYTTAVGYGITGGAALDSWGAITRASGFDAFAATPTGANLASLLTTALPASKGGTGLTALSANVVSLLGAADYSAMRTQLTLVPGTDVQAFDAALSALAGGSDFVAFTGPLTATKTFTLPNASATILTDNAAVTVLQGGTGRATGTTAYGLIAAGTTATGAQQTLAAGATTEILVGGGASALPVWTTANGTGAPVRTTNAALVTPSLGVATATSINGNTFTTGTYTLTGTAGKTLTFSNTLSFIGTDGTTMTFPTSTATLARSDASNTFAGNQTFSGQIIASFSTNSSAVFNATGSGQTSYLSGFRQANAANTDNMDIGQSGSAYAGALLSVGNNQTYFYLPNKVVFARGTAATAAYTFDGATLAVLPTTASTATTSGSATFGGGIGVGGSGYFGGVLSVGSANVTGWGVNDIGGPGTFESQFTDGATATRSWIFRSDSNRINAQIDFVKTAASTTRDAYIDLVPMAANVAQTGALRVHGPNATVSTAFTTDATLAGAGSFTTAGGIYAAKSIVAGTDLIKSTGANGQATNIKSLTELTTIAAAATTDTAIQLPAGAIILSVSVRVTTVIPTATSFSVGDSVSATRFSTANVGVAANSTDVGTKADAFYNASATAVRLTMNGGTPATNTGRVRVTITYVDVTVPTS